VDQHVGFAKLVHDFGVVAEGDEVRPDIRLCVFLILKKRGGGARLIGLVWKKGGGEDGGGGSVGAGWFGSRWGLVVLKACIACTYVMQRERGGEGGLVSLSVCLCEY
jgi:hypothetical protein